MLRSGHLFLMLGITTTITLSTPCGHQKHYHHADHFRDYQPTTPDFDYGADDDDDFAGVEQRTFDFGEGNKCACRLYAERQLVFRNEDNASWYSCTPLGLYRCGQYCDNVLEDETMKFRSRQNACDTIGREINTQWYVRHQVCGEYGPHEDYLMREDLCCQRGRPSDFCDKEAR